MRTILRLLSSIVVPLISFTGISFGQGISTPRVPSPAAEVSQTIGISRVTLNYSRPSVNGREIWGSLVPYGWNVQAFGTGNSAPWRAGANENTTIKFSHDVKVAGQKVPAGTYGLFYVINKDKTGEVILSKDYRSWGSFFYDAKMDQLRAPIQLKEIPPTELLTYDFENVEKNTANLVLNWEKIQFPVKLEFDVDKIVMDNAMEELKGPAGFNWQGPASAANYSLQNKVNMEQGLKWIDQAIAQNKTFTTLSTKSGLLRNMGKTAEADKLMEEGLAMATQNEINTYGYMLMNNKQYDKAIEIFILNTKKYPEDPNTWDSLGEGYFNKGDKPKAIASFKKSLSMNPPPGVKANSEKFLKQMGEM